MTKILKYIPAIFMMLIIFMLSSIPGQIVDSTFVGNEPSEISGHFILFVFLCIAYYKATKNIPLSILFSLLYASFDELHQLYTPGRSCSLFDLGVDTLAASISAIGIWKLLPILPTKLKNWLTN